MNYYTDYTDIQAFHDHELNPTTSYDVRWSQYYNAVEKGLGVDNLDGSQEEDGYSLDCCLAFFCDDLSIAEAVAEFRATIAAI